MAKSNKHFEQYRSIMNFLAESAIEMSDEDVQAEFGSEPPATAKETLRSAAKSYAQGKLRAARSKHEETVRAITTHSFEMPPTATERRALLDAVLAAHMTSELGSLTAQFRDLSSVPDADVESTLRQLEILGVLRKFREKNP